MSPLATAEADAVLDFWFGAAGSAEHGSARKAWFTQGRRLRRRRSASASARTIERALRGELEAWGDEPRSALAQILVLDQFTRNAFRGTPRAFAGDARALAAASGMVGSRQDEALPPFMRAFVYLPFEHAEGLAMQDEAVRLFDAARGERSGAAVDMLDYAHRHRAVIERFGRFPHRNDDPRPPVDGRGDRVPGAAGLRLLSAAAGRRVRDDAGCWDARRTGWERGPRRGPGRTGPARRRGHGRRACHPPRCSTHRSPSCSHCGATVVT